MLVPLKNFRYRLSNSIVRGKYGFLYCTFVPLFFVAGAGLEFVMIEWRPNGHNFYDTFKKNRAKEIATERLELEGFQKSLSEEGLHH